jgi:hypothetical protein
MLSGIGSLVAKSHETQELSEPAVRGCGDKDRASRFICLFG